MLYEQYEKKIQKVAKIKAKIHHFRFAILSGALVLATGISLLVGFKGKITCAAQSEQQFTYGEEYSFDASSFLGSVTWEYKSTSSSKWKEDKPIHVGEYIARAHSKGSFGKDKYSEEINFSILPKDLTITFKQDIVTYGENPTIKTTGLIVGDKVDSYDIIYSDELSYESDVTIDLNTLKILNFDNVLVTSDYNINAVSKHITIAQRELRFTLTTTKFEYNGEYHTLDEDDYKMEGTLAEGDRVVLNSDFNYKNIGLYVPNTTVLIYNSDNEDVTKMYNIIFGAYNSVNIISRTIMFTSKTMEKVYDGYPFAEEEFTAPEITSGSLLSGHHFEYSYTQTDTYLSVETNNYFTVNIYDENNVDVTSSQYCLSQTVGKFNINKRPITIENNSFVYRYGETIDPSIKESLTIEEYNENGRGLAKTDEVMITKTSKIANKPGVGEYPILATTQILRSEDSANVSYCYDINKVTGTLTIEKRDIEVTIESESVVYDGQSHSTNTYVSGGSLASGDSLVAFERKLTQVGSVDLQTIKDDLHIYNEKNANVTSYYNITFITTRDDLEVTARPITIEVPDIHETYDGSAKTLSYSITEGTLASGDILRFQPANTPTHAGHYDVKYSINIYNEENANITHCYSITDSHSGTSSVDIDKKELNITAKTYSKVYDGNSTISTTVDNCFDVTGLLVYDTLSYLGFKTSSPNVGTYHLEIDEENFSILHGVDLSDSTNDYQINYNNDATFEITKRPISIRFDLEKTYDGDKFLGTEYTILGDYQLCEFHTIDVCEFENDHTHVYENSCDFDYDFRIKIIDTLTGEDVTDNYDITLLNSKTTVNKRHITIKTPDTHKYYDGEPLIAYRECTIGDLGLADGDTANFSRDDLAYNLVNVEDTKDKNIQNILEVEIINSDGYDVTDDYDIEWEYGLLEILPRPLTITCPAKVVEYDGQTHEITYDNIEITTTKKNAFISEGVLPYGFSMYGSFSVSEVNHGTYYFNHDITIYDANDNEVDESNFELTFVGGFLLIATRKITLTTATIDCPYTGSDIANSVWVSEGSLAEGHELSYEETETYKDVGTYTNKGFEVTIITAYGEDVTANYDIVWDYGTITIYDD